MIEKHPFGRTGHQSTRTIFGAAAFGQVTQDEADNTLKVLLDYGVNHIDTAASYGESENRIGPWMQQHRDDFFLATKTGVRDYEGAKFEIARSLQRLQVEQIDMIQLHNLVDENEWNTALGSGGALEAAIEARDAGQVRFIGVTGHGLEVARRHQMSLQRFDFDAVLLPCNYLMMQNAQYAADFAILEQTCRERNVAMQTIKAITRRPWGEQTRNCATWYQPLEDQPSIDTAVHWLLQHEGLFLNTVGDIHILPRVLDAASRFDATDEPISDVTMQQLMQSDAMEPLFA
jgi:aryl-alcohol dehydrogenase-like predicted oxidoreductase